MTSEKVSIEKEESKVTEEVEKAKDSSQALGLPEGAEEAINFQDELLSSIDQKLGLLLEQEEKLTEETLSTNNEEDLGYTDILTDLNTNISKFNSLYEEEANRLEAEEALIEEADEPIEQDYTDILIQLDQKLEVVIGIADSVEAAADSIITYSVFYVPLVIIVLSLYWFFSQFINRFY